MPKEDKFFALFKDQGKLIVQGAKLLQELFTDISNAENYVRQIKDVEHRADEITHRTIELLHRTFITPMDREDIHELICKMDDILDYIDATAQRVTIYDVKTVPPGAPELAEICFKSAEAIHAAVQQLGDLKQSTTILKYCVEVNRLENEADDLFRKATGRLFREEPDTRQLIKFKEIYEMMENTTDRCENVANLIEGIVLEYG
jgi:predicted phosphate transport protein (TIGR00153 family)